MSGLNGPIEAALGLREPVSALTHLVGAVFAAAGVVLLRGRTADDPGKRLSMTIYGASLVALYLASGTYHAADIAGGALVVLRKIDHASIFLLIAGTFTPFYANAVDGLWRSANLGMIWTVAVVGIGLKVSFIDMPDVISHGLYVGMGWLSLIGIGKLAAALSRQAMLLTALGGCAYTAGAIVDVIEWPVILPGVVGYHETLHVLVMAGSAIHYAVILRYVVPFDLDATRRLAAAAPLAEPVA